MYFAQIIGECFLLKGLFRSTTLLPPNCSSYVDLQVSLRRSHTDTCTLLKCVERLFYPPVSGSGVHYHSQQLLSSGVTHACLTVSMRGIIDVWKVAKSSDIDSSFKSTAEAFLTV